MRLRTFLWGLAFLAGGTVVAAGWLPGSSAWATGPRVGIAMFLFLVGSLLLGIPGVQAVLHRTTRPEDYPGGCPVGATCSCGHFNFKPRRRCAQCGEPTRYE